MCRPMGRAGSRPQIDRLAREGVASRSVRGGLDVHAVALRDAHGEYASGSRGRACSRDAALIIELAHDAGDVVSKRICKGVVGKWHLGLVPPADRTGTGDPPGPRTSGSFLFIMAATGDRVPTVYVENRRVVDSIPQSSECNTAPLGDWPTGRGTGSVKVHPSHGHDQTIVNGVSGSAT